MTRRGIWISPSSGPRRVSGGSLPPFRIGLHQSGARTKSSARPGQDRGEGAPIHPGSYPGRRKGGALAIALDPEKGGTGRHPAWKPRRREASNAVGRHQATSEEAPATPSDAGGASNGTPRQPRMRGPRILSRKSPRRGGTGSPSRPERATSRRKRRTRASEEGKRAP